TCGGSSGDVGLPLGELKSLWAYGRGGMVEASSLYLAGRCLASEYSGRALRPARSHKLPACGLRTSPQAGSLWPRRRVRAAAATSRQADKLAASDQPTSWQLVATRPPQRARLVSSLGSQMCPGSQGEPWTGEPRNDLARICLLATAIPGYDRTKMTAWVPASATTLLAQDCTHVEPLDLLGKSPLRWAHATRSAACRRPRRGRVDTAWFARPGERRESLVRAGASRATGTLGHCALPFRRAFAPGHVGPEARSPRGDPRHFSAHRNQRARHSHQRTPAAHGPAGGQVHHRTDAAARDGQSPGGHVLDDGWQPHAARRPPGRDHEPRRP